MHQYESMIVTKCHSVTVSHTAWSNSLPTDKVNPHLQYILVIAHRDSMVNAYSLLRWAQMTTSMSDYEQSFNAGRTYRTGEVARCWRVG